MRRSLRRRLSLLVFALTATACGGAMQPDDGSVATDAVDHTAVSDARPDALPLLDAADARASDAVTLPDVRADAAVDAAPDAGPPAVRFVGRIDYGDPAGPRFAWSGSAIQARFRGTGVTVHLHDPGNYFRVAIDGTEQPTLLGHSGTTDYPLATGLADTTHTLEIWRRTEAWEGTTQFLGLTFPAGGALLAPPATPPHRIELIGDSITCGYGDEGHSPCSFTLATENNYLDYGPVTARALDADIVTVAWSGWGMYRGYGGQLADTIPSVYDRTLGTVATSAWDFASWTPDAVVINLGTNDWAMGDPGVAYTNAYVAFVRHLRTHYATAYILASIGPTSAPATRIMAALTTLRAAGDTRLGFLQFASNAGMYSGCDGHPNVAAHAAMATQVETALRAALHW